METIVTKTEKTVQDIEQEVLAYLNKTAKHLFVTEDKMFFKVIPFKVDDAWYYAVIRFNGEKCNMYINSVKRQIEWHGKYTKKCIKDELFPQHSDKKTSITNFKLMREKTFEIVKYLTANYTGTLCETQKKDIFEILKDVKFVEKTQE